MFRWVRTAKIAKGRVPQAIGFAKEISAFSQKKFATPEIRVYLDVTGDVGTVRWEMDFADLATFEKVQTAVMMDADYWQHITKANKDELFIDGTTTDSLMKQI